MRFGNDPILTNGSMSGNITSWGVELSQVWTFSIQANWNGTGGAATAGAGTLNIQVSNDNATIIPSGPAGTDPAANVVNWINYSGASQSVTAATGSSSFMWNFPNPGFRWARLTYTQSSGTGILSANYFGKSV